MSASSPDEIVVEPAAAVAPAAEPLAAAATAAHPDIALLLSLLLPPLLAAFFLLSRRRGSHGNKVLLLGPSNGGKTSVFLRLLYGRVSPTVKSMQPTTASATLTAGSASRNVHLTDTPGSGRLRGHLMSELPGTAALLCILDGTALATHTKEAAQLLYDALTHEAIQHSPPPLLVAVNKSDAAGAAVPAMVRKLLESEVARVRLARTTMQDTSERTHRHRGIAAGDPDQPFSFDQVRVGFARAWGAHTSQRAVNGRRREASGACERGRPRPGEWHDRQSFFPPLLHAVTPTPTARLPGGICLLLGDEARPG